MQTTETWSPSSWRNFPIAQQPEYTNKEELEAVLNKVIPILSLIIETNLFADSGIASTCFKRRR